METEKPTPETEPEQKTTQANQQSAEGEADEPASPPVVQSLNAEGGEPKPAESYGKTDRKQDETLQSIAKQTEWERKQADALEKQTTWMRRQAIWTVALTVLTLGVLIYHGILMRDQWKAANEQTGVMKGQSEAMKAQTDIMSRQLDAMNSDSAQTQQMIDQNRELVGATQGMAEQNRELVGHAGEQAEAAKQSAGAMTDSVKVAERGVRTAAEAMYLEQRPIVGVRTVTLKGAVKQGEQPATIITLQNTGRTPAVNTRNKISISLTNLQIPGPHGPTTTEPSVMVLAPQTIFPIELPISDALDYQAMEIINAHKLRLVVWGDITYEDIFGRSYTTKFCVYSEHPTYTSFFGCSTYNSFT